MCSAAFVLWMLKSKRLEKYTNKSLKVWYNSEKKIYHVYRQSTQDDEAWKNNTRT